MKNKLFLTLLACAVCVGSLKAQAPAPPSLLGQNRVITTTVPFLLITPDARSGAMGDVGVAISPDANLMHWNPAKLAFVPNDMALSVSYTPWLRALNIPDVSLSYLGGYRKIDELSGFGASLRYFSLGDITFTDQFGVNLRDFRPYELAADLGYARKLSDVFSVGIAGRFILSNLAGSNTFGTTQTKPGIAGAGDVSVFYTNDITVNEHDATLSFGGVISNIGSKITYTTAADRDFIPMNLKIGSALNYVINDYNDITFALDINKLLIPSNPYYELDAAGIPIEDSINGGWLKSGGGERDQPVISAMFSSFADAEGGFKEELQEYNISFGMEYWYMKRAAARAGYFYENRNKGNRQYVTLGLGLRYNIFELDFAYLLPTNRSVAGLRSPLENTLRFTLKFNFGENANVNKANPGTPATN